MHTFNVVNQNLPAQAFNLLKKILKRKFEEKGIFEGQPGEYMIQIELKHSLSLGAYHIQETQEGASLFGGGFSALLAGVGALLIACTFDGEGGFRPANTLPINHQGKSQMNGLYFATHFYNFYHVAPEKKVVQQVEDAALRGCNLLAVWYDMHHYYTVEDPESQILIARLKMILAYAKKLGMKTCMTMLSNEAFAGTSPHLQAQGNAQGAYHSDLDGFYHTEICPSRPGGIEEILRQRKMMMAAFKEVPPDYVTYWPYDQGGCTCKACEPWGANGLLKLFPHFLQTIKETWPNTKVIFGTWYFDLFMNGEWEAFYEKAAAGAVDQADYLLGFFPEGKIPLCIQAHGLPGGKEMISFPEISMYGAMPWGGFGANPFPAFLEKTNEKSRGLFTGQLCYSEGVFEDINKMIMLDFCSGRQENALASIKDYVRFEFCMEDTQEVICLLTAMEETLPRTCERENHTCRYVITHPEKVKTIFDTALKLDAAMPSLVKNSWRWRIIMLRAQIDEALLRTNGQVNNEIDGYMAELSDYYFVTPKSNYVVSPPTQNVIAKRFG